MNTMPDNAIATQPDFELKTSTQLPALEEPASKQPAAKRRRAGQEAINAELWRPVRQSKPLPNGWLARRWWGCCDD